MPLINVDRDMACGPKQPGFKSGQLCCLGCSSTDGLSMMKIHDSQPAEAGDRQSIFFYLKKFFFTHNNNINTYQLQVLTDSVCF